MNQYPSLPKQGKHTSPQLNLKSCWTNCPRQTEMSHIFISVSSRMTFPLQQSNERMMVRSLKSDLISDHFAAGSAGQSITLIKLRVKWKVKWVSPCLVPWHIICQLMWSIRQRNLMASWPVISPAKWTHVGPVGPYQNALDQKDSFQQIAVDGN